MLGYPRALSVACQASAMVPENQNRRALARHLLRLLADRRRDRRRAGPLAGLGASSAGPLDTPHAAGATPWRAGRAAAETRAATLALTGSATERREIVPVRRPGCAGRHDRERYIP